MGYGSETLDKPEIQLARASESELLVRLKGKWKIDAEPPPLSQIQQEFERVPGLKRVSFDSTSLGEWDSALLAFLAKLIDYCNKKDIHIVKEGLPDGVIRLLNLAFAVPEKKDAKREKRAESFTVQVGKEFLDFLSSARELFAFIGETSLALIKLFTGQARFRKVDMILLMRRCGAQALPIVSLISILIGLILAFIGAVQLVTFGAQIYVASLVGIAMVRVMGAVMAGIIMAGRTGAAFAAEIGTMMVNEEIDALRTLGVSPMEFLVLPRMIALFLMMPMLCLYADLMGILGGLIVGVFMLDLNPIEYINMTRESVGLADFWIGLFHSAVFGILIALSGCLRGMQCGRSSSAVGFAATSAVVTGIVSIVVATAVITVICNILGI